MVTTTVGIIAFVIAIAGVLAALGHAGYLAMLNSAANKKGASGTPVGQYIKTRWPIAGGTTVAALFALLLTGAESVPVDVLAALLAAGSGGVAVKALQSTQQRYRSGG